MNYSVFIDQKHWGNFTSNKNKYDFRDEMQEQLKHLHPINMSDETAIEYRKRFENSIVYVYKSGEKPEHLVEVKK